MSASRSGDAARAPDAGARKPATGEAATDRSGESRLAKLRILGKEVTIGCRPGEEDALKQAAAYIDASMRDLKARNATSSLEKIAIVTAINTADALLKARAGHTGEPGGSGASLLMADGADGLDPERLRGRLADLNASIDDLLAEPSPSVDADSVGERDTQASA